MEKNTENSTEKKPEEVILESLFEIITEKSAQNGCEYDNWYSE